MNLLLTYKPENPQEDYMFIGRSLEDNTLHAGYLVVNRKWFVDIKNCDHYIYENQYKEGGLCGSLIDVPEFKTTKVDPKSIRPYDQIAQIMLAQEKKLDVLIVKDAKVYPIDKDDNLILCVKPNDALPLHLYGSKREV